MSKSPENSSLVKIVFHSRLKGMRIIDSDTCMREKLIKQNAMTSRYCIKPYSHITGCVYFNE